MLAYEIHPRPPFLSGRLSFLKKKKNHFAVEVKVGEGEWGAKEENKTYARGPVEFRGHEDFYFIFVLRVGEGR